MQKIFFILLIIFFQLDTGQSKSKIALNQQRQLTELISSERKVAVEYDQDKLRRLINNLEEDQRSDFFAKYLGYDDAACLLSLTIKYEKQFLKGFLVGSAFYGFTDSGKLKFFSYKNHKFGDINECSYKYSGCSRSMRYQFFYDGKNIKILDTLTMTIILSDVLTLTDDDFWCFNSTANSFCVILNNVVKIFNCTNKEICNKRISIDLTNLVNLFWISDEKFLLVFKDKSIVLYDFMNDLRVASGNLDLEGDLLLYNDLLGSYLIYSNKSKVKLATYEDGNIIFKELFSCQPNEELISGHSFNTRLFIKLKHNVDGNAFFKYMNLNFDKLSFDETLEEKDEVIFWAKEYYITQRGNTIEIKDIKNKKIKRSILIDGDFNFCEYDDRLYIISGNTIQVLILPQQFEKFTFEQKQLIHDLLIAKENFGNKIIKFDQQQQKVFSTFNDLIQQMIRSHLNIVFA